MQVLVLPFGVLPCRRCFILFIDPPTPNVWFVTVVWNPWDKKAKALADFGDEDYKVMLCVDSAAIENRIVLKPHEEWRGCQELSTVHSSYCSGQLDPWKVLHG